MDGVVWESDGGFGFGFGLVEWLRGGEGRVGHVGWIFDD